MEENMESFNSEGLNSKAFTLIELLAIIVILAIIAVITVPIILNIIENSKMGAAIDSAYGFKDSVNKYYMTELSKNHSLELNGKYTVLNGVLNGPLINNKEIPISGNKPSNGYLNYSNNFLTTGCLTIGDYRVIFENGDVKTTEKGICNLDEVDLNCTDSEELSDFISYTIVDKSACETYFINDRNCNDDEWCIENVSNYCSDEPDYSIIKDIEDGRENPDLYDFILQKKESWCLPKVVLGNECFEFSYTGSRTVNVSRYLCGAEWDEDTESYITVGKVLDVNIPSEIVTRNGKLTVTGIGKNAFQYSQLTSVIIPSTITYIGNWAFSSNQLTGIELPIQAKVGYDIVAGNSNLSTIRIGNETFTLNTEYNTCGMMASSTYCAFYRNVLSNGVCVDKIGDELRINHRGEYSW
jgi:type II secretory pathway pseudopilin PulG